MPPKANPFALPHTVGRWLRGLLVLLLFCAAPHVAAQAPVDTLLLVATPQLEDPFFAKSVVLVIRHGQGPPLGVILNYTVRLPAERREPAIHIGGPVSTEHYAFVMHSATPPPGGRLLQLPGQWYFGIATDYPAATLAAPGVTAHKVFRGISLWDAEQLEQEIIRGDWLLQPFDASLFLREDDEAMWKETLARARARSI